MFGSLDVFELVLPPKSGRWYTSFLSEDTHSAVVQLKHVKHQILRWWVKRERPTSRKTSGRSQQFGSWGFIVWYLNKPWKTFAEVDGMGGGICSRSKGLRRWDCFFFDLDLIPNGIFSGKWEIVNKSTSRDICPRGDWKCAYFGQTMLTCIAWYCHFFMFWQQSELVKC